MPGASTTFLPFTVKIRGPAVGSICCGDLFLAEGDAATCGASFSSGWSLGPAMSLRDGASGTRVCLLLWRYCLREGAVKC